MQYTDKEKFAIVQRHQAGEPIHALCQEYGISRSTLYRWEKHTALPTHHQIVHFQ